MKRWKITTAKTVPVTCENCEEGRLIVCHLSCNTAMLIRMRKRSHLYNSNSELVGPTSDYTFIRYLDPDPETPKHVRVHEAPECAVYTVAGEHHRLRWMDGRVYWCYDTEFGLIQSSSVWLAPQSQLVTLTSQVAELVEEEQ